MYARRGVFACCCVQVAEQLVSIEWCDRCDETAQGVETSVECLISTEFIGSHFASPETWLVETDVPIAEEIDHEALDESSCWCRIEVVKVGLHVLHEVVQLAE